MVKIPHSVLQRLLLSLKHYKQCQLYTDSEANECKPQAEAEVGNYGRYVYVLAFHFFQLLHQATSDLPHFGPRL